MIVNEVIRKKEEKKIAVPDEFFKLFSVRKKILPVAHRDRLRLPRNVARSVILHYRLLPSASD